MESLVANAVLAYLAAILLIAAALQRRPRISRLLMTLAGGAACAHLALTGAGLAWLSFAALFTAINAVHYGALAMRARSGRLLDDERALFDDVMMLDQSGHQRHLRDLIDWRDVTAGEALVQQGQRNPPLIYVARGQAAITIDDKPIGECAAGDFLGEMSLISGDAATATVTAVETMRVARFDREALAQLARAAPDVGRALDNAVNRSLAAKLLRMNVGAAARGEAISH